MLDREKHELADFFIGRCIVAIGTAEAGDGSPRGVTLFFEDGTAWRAACYDIHDGYGFVFLSWQFGTWEDEHVQWEPRAL